MRKLVDDDSDNDVSLFPFLSIIAAIIGVLTLMIAAITLDQMNQGDSKQIVANAIQNNVVSPSAPIKVAMILCGTCV